MAPEFLQLDEVVHIHRDQIARYGGLEGIRDLGLLKSALAMPEAGVGGEYFHEAPFGMAAAYLFHLVANHPFVDGNKRVGAMAAFTFLRLNGWTLASRETSYERLVRSVAEGSAGKEQAAAYFRKHCRRAASSGRPTTP